MRTMQNLDGIWNFSFLGQALPEPPFHLDDYSMVPGCFDLIEPYCGKRGYAVYSRPVTVGGLVRLDIDGLGLEARIYWDDRLIGEVKYAYMPEEFIFDAGAEGEHELAILLNNQFTPRFEPYFDFYGYGGIYGDVIIEKLPGTYLENLQIVTEDYQTGTIRIKASAVNQYGGQTTIDIDGISVIQTNFHQGTLDLLLQVPDFRLWSPDAPNCHVLTLSIEEDQLQESFGIRQVQTKGRDILLNGKKIKLIGVNRHESHPTCGAAMPRQLIEHDLKMLKNSGFNFIRGCHYAQRRQTLRLCDKIGMLVWEETLGWDIKAPRLHAPEFLADQIQQAEELARRHANHPCIIFRGFLNENESEKNETRHVIQTLARKLRKSDPKALVTYASNRYAKDVCTDLVDVVAMNPYPGWYDANYEQISTCDRISGVLQELSRNMPVEKPFLITEIGAEAIYGFRDELKTYWSEEYQAQVLTEAVQYALEHTDCAGIAIWHFADTRSYVNGPHIFGRARGFNNKGMLDEFRRPKLAWQAVADTIAGYNVDSNH